MQSMWNVGGVYKEEENKYYSRQSALTSSHSQKSSCVLYFCFAKESWHITGITATPNPMCRFHNGGEATNRSRGGINETGEDGRKSSDMNAQRSGDQASGRDGKRKEGEGGREGFRMSRNSDGVTKPLTHLLGPLRECRRHKCSSEDDEMLIRTTESLQEHSWGRMSRTKESPQQPSSLSRLKLVAERLQSSPGATQETPAWWRNPSS